MNVWILLLLIATVWLAYRLFVGGFERSGLTWKLFWWVMIGFALIAFYVFQEIIVELPWGW